MTKNQRLKMLKSHQWKEEESKLSLHILSHWKTVHLQGRYVYGRELFTASVYAIVNGYGFEWVRADETREVLDWVFSKYKINKAYLLKKDKEFEEISQEIKRLSDGVLKKGVDGFSNKQLSELLARVNKLGNKMYGYSMFTEGADALTEADYQRLLPTVAKQDVLGAARDLSISEEASFVEKERLALLKLALLAARDSNALNSPDFLRAVETHAKRYFWTQTSFYEAVFLDREYFLGQVKKLLKEKSIQDIQKAIQGLENRAKEIKAIQQGLCKKYKLTEDAELFFELVRYFLILQDRRKENLQRLVFCIDEVLQETAKRFGMKKETLSNYYFVAEVLGLLASGKKVGQSELNKRKKVVSVSWVENNGLKTDWLFGKEAEEVVEFFKQKRKEAAGDVLRGFVASAGKGLKVMQGKVRLVVDPAKDVFCEGEILVAGMTRPEFVPLMRKAAGIITNEGGITTHAAIVSRELGVPCIIGTRVATDVLKSGDEVQMDLVKGTIKVLKKNAN